MRLAFSLVLVCAAAFYTGFAFTELNFLSQMGRLGPGFFPRVIGVSLLAFALYALYLDLKARRSDGELSATAGVALVVVLLTAAFILALEVLGGLLAMAAFLLVALSVLNRRQHIVNVALAAVLPVGLYLVFRVWLNAALPDGLLTLPI